MTEPTAPGPPRFRPPDADGPLDPLPRELDTVEGWHARARLVPPDATADGHRRAAGAWLPVYAVNATVPIESDADLDATSAAPRASREPGVDDDGPGQGTADDDAGS
jgi:hypothetical protein